MAHTKTSRSSTAVKEQRRKSLRIQISSEVKFKIYSDYQQNFQNSFYQAKMLNISEGGTLLISKKYVPEGSFVSLVLKLKGFENLEDILGKVKRVDKGNNGVYLLGVEFCRPQKNFDFPSFQNKQIHPQFSDFAEKLRRILIKHLHS